MNPRNDCRRVTINKPPFPGAPELCPWSDRGQWPAQWVTAPNVGAPPFVLAFQRRFTAEQGTTIRVHVTADERYELFLDGKRVGRGPERGDRFSWFYETYDLSLSSGEHLLWVQVWALGDLKPWAQVSVRPGWLLAAQDPEWNERIGTGVAPWEARRLRGYEFVPSRTGAGPAFTITAGIADDPWQPAVISGMALDGATASQWGNAPILRPATLPPMLETPRQIGRVRLVESGDNEASAWQRLLDGTGAVTVPAKTTRRVLVDLENYFCAYPELVTSGGAGAVLRVGWQESLFNEPAGQTKPPRDEVAGKFFVSGMTDTFRPDDGTRRLFEPLWWRAGRYVQIVVETAATPVTIEAFRLRETRYPFEPAAEFAASDDRLAKLTPVLVRSWQMCAHETYMDCPFYEQLMYVGDTRLQALLTYCLTTDDRLPRKALRMFAASRLPNGLTRSNYPSGGVQIIPPFSLWWVAMLHDFLMWRGDRALVAELLPAARGVVDTFLTRRNPDGLVVAPPGWNYVDWVPDRWQWGEPPGAQDGVSGIINWHVVYTLQLLAGLEEEAELAGRARRLAADLAARTRAAFWAESRGLFADDLAHQQFSEHAQALAVLCGEKVPALVSATGLTPCSIYFTHYLFEAYRRLGRTDVLLNRLGLWFDLAKWGFKTTYENDVPARTRSDCHAWGAHPLYHYFASILGIRPAAPGFERVEIAPQLGPLPWANGTMPHPRGTIAVELTPQGGTIELPAGVSGVFRQGGVTRELQPGRQSVP